MKLPRPALPAFATGLGALALALLAAAPAARADENVIRKTLAERFQNLPKIDEVRPAPVAGLWELRIGTEVMYTDAKGAYLIQGSIIDTATRKDLTQERIDKLTAIDFASLPLKDAIVWKNGNGKRRIAVFGDPNCGYCKRLEKDLINVKDVTVYNFVIPILGGDSADKAPRDLVRQGQHRRLARLDGRRRRPAAGDGPVRRLGDRAQRGAGAQAQGQRHAGDRLRGRHPRARRDSRRRDRETAGGAGQVLKPTQPSRYWQIQT